MAARLIHARRMQAKRGKLGIVRSTRADLVFAICHLIGPRAKPARVEAAPLEMARASM
jgi:hypothetical protein